MAIGIKSAYSYTSFLPDQVEPNKRILTERVPFKYRPYRDNLVHEVVQGDTLFSIASKYFNGLIERPAGLWWIVQDFQPVPVHDPTLELAPGSNIIVPSQRTVIENIFNEGRVGES